MITKDAIQELAQAEAILKAGTSVSSAISGGDDSTRGAIALPNNFEIKDLEKYMPNRRRVTGNMATSVVADFAKYAALNKEEGAAIFIDPKSMSATAVLNMGTPANPGHCDNTTTLAAERTAAYTALLQITQRNVSHGQKDIAEFVEDWSGIIKCSNGDEIINSKAIAAIRSITIEALRKIGNEEKNLGTTRTAFENIEATSEHTIPTEISFTCVPYKDMAQRTFAMRLGILTGSDKPSIVLRIIKVEEHEEQMAMELADLVSDAIGEGMPVMIGKFSTKQ